MTDEPRSWEVAEPTRFTVGALGEPGHRVFYFQVFAPDVEVEVKCEKQQATALAEHLTKMLADLPETEPPTVAETAPTEALPPAELEFVVGPISLGVDRNAGRLVVLFEEWILDETDEEDEDAEATPSPADEREPSRLRVHLDAAQVRGYVRQLQELLGASRPTCRLCNRPIDPEGHACPRLN